MSSHIMSCHLILSHVMSCHLMSCHVILSYLMSCHAILSHVMSCHLILSHVILFYLMSCHVILSYLMSCHLMSCHICLCIPYGRGILLQSSPPSTSPSFGDFARPARRARVPRPSKRTRTRKILGRLWGGRFVNSGKVRKTMFFPVVPFN